MNWLAAWWRQPDHFDWLTGYLQVHGLSTNTPPDYGGGFGLAGIVAG